MGKLGSERQFDVALRGYDCDQVDEYLARLDAALLRLGAGERVEAPPAAQFDVALRGYDRGQVDARIEQMTDVGRRLWQQFAP